MADDAGRGPIARSVAASSTSWSDLYITYSIDQTKLDAECSMGFKEKEAASRGGACQRFGGPGKTPSERGLRARPRPPASPSGARFHPPVPSGGAPRRHASPSRRMARTFESSPGIRVPGCRGRRLPFCTAVSPGRPSLRVRVVLERPGALDQQSLPGISSASSNPRALIPLPALPAAVWPGGSMAPLRSPVIASANTRAVCRGAPPLSGSSRRVRPRSREEAP